MLIHIECILFMNKNDIATHYSLQFGKKLNLEWKFLKSRYLSFCVLSRLKFQDRRKMEKAMIDGHSNSWQNANLVDNCWIYFTWPLRKQAAYFFYKQATRGPMALSPFRRTRQWRFIKCLAHGHDCRCQQILTGDLTIESVVLSTEPQQFLEMYSSKWQEYTNYTYYYSLQFGLHEI